MQFKSLNIFQDYEKQSKTNENETHLWLHKAGVQKRCPDHFSVHIVINIQPLFDSLHSLPTKITDFISLFMGIIEFLWLNTTK